MKVIPEENGLYFSISSKVLPVPEEGRHKPCCHNSSHVNTKITFGSSLSLIVRRSFPPSLSGWLSLPDVCSLPTIFSSKTFLARRMFVSVTPASLLTLTTTVLVVNLGNQMYNLLLYILLT